MPKFLLLVAGFALLSLNCLSQATANTASLNTLSNSEKKDGWKLLFDGRSTSGWHSFGKKAAGPSWKTSDGNLYYDTTNERVIHDRDLVTNNEFENYHLKYEWKIAPKGNSGLLFDVNEDTTNYKETSFYGP